MYLREPLRGLQKPRRSVIAYLASDNLNVIFVLIFAGMHREEISADSSLAYPDFGAAGS